MAFEFEITPKSLVISPDNPLQVQVKNCSGKEQDVYLTVHSLLFRILNPTAANKCHETQFYSNMKANETLHFQIGLLDEATLNRPIQDGGGTYFNSTEGDFTVMYAPDLSAYVNNNSLYVCTYEDTGFYSKSMCADAMNESFPLVLERETEPSKKRRSEHKKYMKNHVKEFEKPQLEKKEKEAMEAYLELDKRKRREKEEQEKKKKKRRRCILM